MEAWRWRFGAGGLALEASWPVTVRRRALGAMLQCSTSACRSWRCSWRGVARRGAAWLGVACGVASEWRFTTNHRARRIIHS